MTRGIEYRPQIVSPPGETLQELLEEMNLSQAELAERTGHSQKMINEIIKGKAPISQETALNFEKVLGTSATFWNTREQHYREFLTAREEKLRLEKSIGWLTEIPYRELQERGYIPSTNDKVAIVNALLSFFAISSVNQWHTYWKKARVSFRSSKLTSAKIGAIAAWLRVGEIEASKIQSPPYDDKLFEPALKEIRESIIDNFEWKEMIQQLCSEAGVAVVFTPQIKGIGIYGSARWLSPTKPLIQMSMRGKRDDQFWFTFFHEATHILKHKKKAVYLDDIITEQEGVNDEENEANESARNFLIPTDEWKEFVTASKYTSTSIIMLSRKIKITEGVIVGRLQHENLVPPYKFQNLKVEID